MFAVPARAALSRTRSSATLALAPRIARNSLSQLTSSQNEV
jgi:hypothetical protein